MFADFVAQPVECSVSSESLVSELRYRGVTVHQKSFQTYVHALGLSPHRQFQ